MAELHTTVEIIENMRMPVHQDELKYVMQTAGYDASRPNAEETQNRFMLRMMLRAVLVFINTAWTLRDVYEHPEEFVEYFETVWPDIRAFDDEP